MELEEAERIILDELAFDSDTLAKIDARAAAAGLSRWQMVSALIRAILMLDSDTDHGPSAPPAV